MLTSALSSLLASVVLTTAVGPAGAHAPQQSDTPLPDDTATCSTRVTGYDADGDLHRIKVKDGTLGADLPAPGQHLRQGQPGGVAYQGFRTTRKTLEHSYLLTFQGGRVRTGTLTYAKATGRSSWGELSKLVGGPYRFDVLAGGYGWAPYVYASTGTALYRYDWLSDASGDQALERAGKVSDTDFTALVSLGRWWIDRVPHDLLYGVTARGALVQVRVPRGRAAKAVTTVVARTGFAGVDELSTGSCALNPDGIGLVAIDRDARAGAQARYWELSDLRAPTRADLTGGDPVAGDVDWGLDAVR